MLSCPENRKRSQLIKGKFSHLRKERGVLSRNKCYPFLSSFPLYSIPAQADGFWQEHKISFLIAIPLIFPPNSIRSFGRPFGNHWKLYFFPQTIHTHYLHSPTDSLPHSFPLEPSSRRKNPVYLPKWNFSTQWQNYYVRSLEYVLDLCGGNQEFGGWMNGLGLRSSSCSSHLKKRIPYKYVNVSHFLVSYHIRWFVSKLKYF